jgi:hypothetical protein
MLMGAASLDQIVRRPTLLAVASAQYAVKFLNVAVRIAVRRFTMEPSARFAANHTLWYNTSRYEEQENIDFARMRPGCGMRVRWA